MNMDASILEDAPIISLKMRKPHYAKPTGAPAVEAASHITGNNTISGSDFPKIFNAIDQDVEAKFKRHFWSQTRCETKFCSRTCFSKIWEIELVQGRTLPKFDFELDFGILDVIFGEFVFGELNFVEIIF